MSMLHKGETLAKTLRGICNFRPEFPWGTPILHRKASVGNAGLQEQEV